MTAPRAAAPRKGRATPASGRPGGRGASGGAAFHGASAGLRRWGRAAALGLGVFLGVPVVHALFGDLGVLIVAAMLLGFLLGRWSVRRA